MSTNTNTRDRAMICYNCKHSTSIFMFEVIKIIIKPDTKKMMRFVLGRYTAIIIVFFTKYTISNYIWTSI